MNFLSLSFRVGLILSALAMIIWVLYTRGGVSLRRKESILEKVNDNEIIYNIDHLLQKLQTDIQSYTSKLKNPFSEISDATTSCNNDVNDNIVIKYGQDINQDLTMLYIASLDAKGNMPTNSNASYVELKGSVRKVLFELYKALSKNGLVEYITEKYPNENECISDITKELNSQRDNILLTYRVMFHDGNIAPSVMMSDDGNIVSSDLPRIPGFNVY